MSACLSRQELASGLSWLGSSTLLATKFRRLLRRPVRWSSSGSSTFPLGSAPEHINYINYGVHTVTKSLRDGGGVPISTCLYTWIGGQWWKHESLHYVTSALTRAKVNLRQIWERMHRPTGYCSTSTKANGKWQSTSRRHRVSSFHADLGSTMLSASSRWRNNDLSWEWEDVKLLHELFRGGRFGQGQPLVQKIKIFGTRPKIVACPSNFEKTIVLAFLKVTLTHKSHIECISPSHSQIQYICSLPLSK